MADTETQALTIVPAEEALDVLWSDSERIADIHRMIRDIHTAVMPVVPTLVAAKTELDTKGLAGLFRAVMMPGMR